MNFEFEAQHRLDTNGIAFLKGQLLNRWLGIRLEVAATTLVAAVALASALAARSLSPGLVGLILSYSLTFTSMLNYGARYFTDTETALASVERIDHYSKVYVIDCLGLPLFCMLSVFRCSLTLKSWLLLKQVVHLLRGQALGRSKYEVCTFRFDFPQQRLRQFICYRSDRALPTRVACRFEPNNSFYSRWREGALGSVSVWVHLRYLCFISPLGRNRWQNWIRKEFPHACSVPYHRGRGGVHFDRRNRRLLYWP